MEAPEEFERRLRKLLEAEPLESAQAYVLEAVEGFDDVVLQSAVRWPLAAFAIENWVSMGADLEEAKRMLAPADQGKGWQSVFVGLINNSETPGPRAEISFGLGADYSVGATPLGLPGLSAAELERLELDLATRVVLPEGRRYTAGSGVQPLRITGLDDVDAIQRIPISCDQGERAWTRSRVRRTLASAIILVRFHQLVERYATDPGLPHPMALFAHVVGVEWPMEAGIVEYGTQATRVLKAATDRFDHVGAAAIAEERKRQRAASFDLDTRRIIAEMRERQEALVLWPWWRDRRHRRIFARFVRDQRRLNDYAMRTVRGVRTAGLSGDALYRAISAGRNPGDAEAGLEPIAPEDRQELHYLAIAYARTFGGDAVRHRFMDYPDRDPDLFERAAALPFTLFLPRALNQRA